MDDADRVVRLTELETYMRVDFDANASVVAADILDLTQGALEGWLNRPVTIREFTEDLRINRLKETKLYLPATPVIDIVSVAIDGGDALIEDTDYIFRPWGLDEFYKTGTTATVTWTAGWDGRARENSALRFAVLRAAARDMQHWLEGDQGLEEVRSEGYHAKFIEPAAVFTNRELQLCVRFKKRVFA